MVGRSRLSAGYPLARGGNRAAVAGHGPAPVRQGLNPGAIFVIAMGKPDDFAKGR